MEQGAQAREGVAVDVRGGLAVVTLSRPSTRNALRLEDWLALPPLVASAERSPEVRAILLRGAGGRFGAGNDIAQLAALRHDPAMALSFGRAMAQAMTAVETASKPVIAGLEGVCYGASVALALAADLRVASDAAVFAITPAKLGALYLNSDLHRLVRTVGHARARQMIFTAEPIGAADALRIGLVDAVWPLRDFDQRLQALVASIEAGSQFTLARTKEMLIAADGGRASAETEESLASFVEATQGADFAEGVRAFLERRPPRFA